MLRTLIDHIPDSIYVRDTANRFVLANETQARRLGVATPADLLGKTDADFFTAEQAAHLAATDHEVFAGRALLNYEQSLLLPNGERKVVLSTKVPLKNAEGVVTGMVGIGRDITDRKLAEEALRQSEARFRLLWNQSADGIRLTDAAGKVIMANPAYCQLMGLPPADVQGHLMSDVYRVENRPKILADHQTNFAAHSVKPRVETQVTLWNGETLWVEVSNSFLEHTGAEPLLLALFRNITARKRAEENLTRLATAVEQADETIVITDPSGAMVYANPAFEKSTGYTRAEALGQNRSEERRVGKECRSRWSPYH